MASSLTLKDLDSSDDEDKSNDYDIQENIEAFKLEKKRAEIEADKIDKNTVLSFIAHAAGVRSLYCPSVKARYKELKKEYLIENKNDFDIDKPIMTYDLSKLPPKDFDVYFRAYLRLHNRIAKIDIAKIENNPNKINPKIKKVTWKIFETKKIKVENSIKAFDKIYRNEEVKFKNLKRQNDKITARYATIIEELDKKPEQKEILLNTRINIKNTENIEILDEYSLTFWYLFFGCEVTRSPAALIHHNMGFDLIKWGELMWNDLKEKIPMTQKGSLIKSIKLNSDYSKFMPHKYSYQNDSEFNAGWVNDFLEKQADITEKWLKRKLGNTDEATSLISQCENDNSAVKKIYDLILESFNDWKLSE